MPFHAPPADDEQAAPHPPPVPCPSGCGSNAPPGPSGAGSGRHTRRRTAPSRTARTSSWWLTTPPSSPGRPGDSVGAAVASLEEVSAQVRGAVLRLDLDTPVPVPPAPWNPTDVPAWSVRWVWFHLVEELARHAGHADIIREAVDGATMYPLVAAAEGLPATDWLAPWTP